MTEQEIAGPGPIHCFMRSLDNMSIHQLFCELDELILRNFGDLESTLRTEPGQRLFQQILSEKNREQLRAWYKKPLGSRQLNSLAIEIKQKLESELGEDL